MTLFSAFRRITVALTSPGIASVSINRPSVAAGNHAGSMNNSGV